MKKCIECKVNDIQHKNSNLCDKCFDKALEEKIVQAPEASWW